VQDPAITSSHSVTQTFFFLHREEITHRVGGSYRVAVQKSLIGVVALTRYNNKTYRIDDIDWNQSPKSTFSTYRDGEVSIFIWLLEHQSTSYYAFICLVPHRVVELHDVSGYALQLCDAMTNGREWEFFGPENGDGLFL